MTIPFIFPPNKADTYWLAFDLITGVIIFLARQKIVKITSVKLIQAISSIWYKDPQFHSPFSSGLQGLSHKQIEVQEGKNLMTFDLPCKLLWWASDCLHCWISTEHLMSDDVGRDSWGRSRMENTKVKKSDVKQTDHFHKLINYSLWRNKQVIRTFAIHYYLQDYSPSQLMWVCWLNPKNWEPTCSRCFS